MQLAVFWPLLGLFEADLTAKPPALWFRNLTLLIDTLLAHLERFDPEPVKAQLDVTSPYAVATLHRPANVDTAEAASVAIMKRRRSLRSRRPAKSQGATTPATSTHAMKMP